MLISSYITPKAVKGRLSAIQGRGLVAVAPITKDEIVAIKGGHIIDRAQLDALPAKLRKSKVQIADNFYLCALHDDEYEQVALFLNHSCEPNVGFAGNVVLIAMRDILTGEELTTDYALSEDNQERMQCQCHTTSCRGIVAGGDWRRPELQYKYGSYFSWYLFRRFSR